MTAFSDFVPEEEGLVVRLAARPTDYAAANELRHHVFCIEQGLFTDDRDENDEIATTLVALSAHEVIGTVRIHEAQPGIWFGSRLAVAKPWRRRAGAGAGLIRLAVSTAHGRGCRRFLAHVQEQNIAFFEGLHWRQTQTTLIQGAVHSLMEADLDHYPPIAPWRDQSHGQP